MPASTKVLLATTALGAALLWLLSHNDDASPGVRFGAPVNDSRVASTDSSAPPTSTRTTLPDEAEPPTVLLADWLVHPFAYEFDIRVIDSLGIPVEGHTVKLCPVGCSRNLADVSTDADGHATIRWHGRQQEMTVEIEEPREQARRVRMRSGAPVAMELLEEAYVPDQRMKFTSAALIPNPERRMVPEPFRVRGGEVVRMRSGLHPFARFAQPTAVDAEQSTTASRREDQDVDPNRWRHETPSGSAAAIVGTVLGHDGRALADIPVRLFGNSPQPFRGTNTEADGSFRFEGLAAGDYVVRAGGDRDGLAVTNIVASSGMTSTTLQLHPGATVRGQALTADGKPIAQSVIEWRSLDDRWADCTRADSNGTFVLANLPPGPGTVTVLPPGRTWQQALAVASNVMADSGDLILRAQSPSGSTLTLQPCRVDELSEWPVLRLWNQDTGLGTRMEAAWDGGSWRLTDLPAGFYELDAWVPGAGHHSLGRHCIDGTTPVDLGRVELPLGGTVQFSIAEGADAAQRVLELVSLRADADVFVALDEIPTDRPVHLPAGDHALLYRHADGSPRAQRFTVKAGERTEVAVPR